MNKISHTLFLLIFLNSHLFSQSEFVPGYIQTTKNDTIFGLIDYQMDDSNAKECRFRKTMDDEVEVYYPMQIYGYRFIGSKNYISRQIITRGVEKTLFLEYLVEGVVDLYFYRNVNDDHYLLGKQNSPIKEISIADEPVFVNGVPYERRIFVNRDLLKYYFEDCPALFDEINRTNECRHKSLIKMVKKYHDLQCPNDVCLVYQKEMPKFRVDIQPFIGIVHINPTTQLGNIYTINKDYEEYSLQYGVLAYFWLPLVSEKMFLKTGLIVNHLKGNYSRYYGHREPREETGFKIPLQVHYQFFKSDITPVVSGGFNLYSTPEVPFSIFPDINVGLNAKITNRLYATLSAGFDYWSPNFIVPTSLSQIVTYSLNAGLAVKLE